MRMMDLPGKILGKTVSKGSLFSILGSYATSQWMVRSRKRWEDAREKRIDALLDEISAYDIGKGAGKLIKGWLSFSCPEASLTDIEKKLKKLLGEMDQEDNLPEEKARSRFLISKALFYVEGFKLSHCRYEVYQKAAWEFLRKNPAHKKLTRNDVFQGKAFLPEDLIATTHRILLTLDDGLLIDFIHRAATKTPLRDEADYMANLIALTLQADKSALGATIDAWFATYCDFKIDQSHQREAVVNTSITTATGGLPMSVGMELVSRAGKALFPKGK